MKIQPAIALALALAGGALLATTSIAQSAFEKSKTQDAAKESVAEKVVANFEAPVVIKSGEAIMGREYNGESRNVPSRYYPSPAFHDMNGDGLQDLVIGDLMGLVTVSLRKNVEGPAQWEAEFPLKDNKGQDWKFRNW